MAQLLFTGGFLTNGSNLELALQLVENRLAAWASNSDAYNALLHRVFAADKASPPWQAAADLQTSLLEGGLQIPLKILPAASLNGINGAYTNAAPDGGECIYINAAWLQSAAASQLEAMLLEEIGHAIDQRLNGHQDMAGDEGEIFSAQLRGLAPNPMAFTEDDHRLIYIDGIPISIEAETPDYAETTNTTGSISVGGSATGRIDPAYDQDWFSIALTGGITYLFNLNGSSEPNGTPLYDPYLYFYDANGKILALNDDFNGYNSQITFTPSDTGTYFLGAAAYSSNTGSYTLLASISGSGSGKTAAVTSINDNVGIVQGTVASGATTDDTSPSIGGTISTALVAGETVRIYDGANLLGTATVSGTSWSYSDTRTLVNTQSVSYTARVADAAGNQSAAGTAYTATIDITAAAPSLALANDTGGSNTDSITNIGTVNVSGLETGASWQYSVNGGSSWLNGTGTSFFLTPGTYAAGSILVRQSDLAGNTSANGQLVAVTIDTTAPTGSLGSGYATTPAYAPAATNPFGIGDVGLLASPAFADADRDGDLDLFIGNFSGCILFFRNTANPGATAPAYAAAYTPAFGITSVGLSASPSFVDIDGDGDLDLFIGDGYGNTLFFRNTASPGATAPAYAAATTNPFGISYVEGYASPAFADADADGDLDLFIGNYNGNTLFFKNTANPGATSPAYAAAATNPFGIVDVGFYASPALADADADGDLDLFIGGNNGNTLFFRNTANPGATAPAYAAASTNPFGISDVGYFATPAFADVDADGDLDLFIGEYYGNTLFFKNTANPSATALVAPVASSTTNGSYGIGAVITLSLQFSETLYVTTSGGTPRLQLETGAIDRYAIYSGGSGSNTLSFTYTVQAGDSSADLDQFSANALELNGGTIRDAAGNNAILTLAAPGAPGSLAANGALVINGIALTTPSLALASDTGISNSDGITNNSTVNISGLEPGASWQYSVNGGSSWLAGTGTSFSLTPGTYAAGSILVRQSDLAGNTSANGQLGAITIDTTTPTVNSVVATGSGISSGNGNLNTGRVVTLTVNTSEPVTISGGTPSLSLNSGGSATYTSGSGTNSLVFSYTVAAGNSSSDLAITALNANGALLRDAAGNSFASFSNSPAGVLAIDTTAPAAPTLTLASDSGISNTDGITNIGTISISNLEAGASWQYSINGGSSWLLGTGTSFSVAPGTYTAGSIRARQSDLAGNTSANGQLGAITVDTTAPTGSQGRYATAAAYAAAATNAFGIRDVGFYAKTAFADADADGDLDLFIGELYGCTLFFRNTANPGATATSYAVAATNPSGISDVGFYASPALADADRDGDLDLFIGEYYGNTLFFRNTANPGAAAPAYAAAATNPFGISDVGDWASPAFADADGDGDLDLFIGERYGNSLFFRNTANPGAIAPAYAAAATNPFGIGDVGNNASPAFADADRDGDLDLFIGNSDGCTLFFRNTGSATAPAYAAAATNPFGISDVGSFASPAFADADADDDLDLFVGNRDGNTLFFRNTANPGAATPVAPVVSTNANGSYGIGAVISLSLQFSEAVYVTTTGGTPRLQLETGAIDRHAIYSGGSGTTTLSFSYTVQAGDSSADLDQLSANALELNGGVIQDAAGNNTILTLAAPGTPGSLAANRALVIDGIAPAAPGLALAKDSGISNSDGITNIGTVNVSNLETSASWQYSINGGGSWLAGTGTSFTLAPGTYAAGSILVRQIDLVGNTSAHGQLGAITIDTTAASGSLGSYATAPAYAAASTNPFGITDVGYSASPAFADADGDGDLDLFIGNSSGCSLFFRNTANPGATAPAYVAAANNPFGLAIVSGKASPAFADADGDGDLDLFIGDSSGNTLFFRNTANLGATAPAYAAAATNPFGISDVGFSASPAFADADADGDLDLFIGEYYGNTLFFRNTGSATAPAYAAASTNPFGITDVGYSAKVSFADIDRDGDLDLFIGEYWGNTPFFRNTAAAGNTIPAYATASANPFGIANVGRNPSPAFADADGDGDLDLFIGNQDGNTLFFRNTAAAPVVPVTSINANGSYGIGAVITLTLQFSETVLVTTTGGTPRLQLETGAVDRYAIYSGGSGTTTLSFSYTIQAGDSSADLDQLSNSALELNGGTIRDAAGNNAILSLATPGAAGSLAANKALVIDGSAPTAPGLAMASDTGVSTSDRITNIGTVNVTGLENGASWQYSVNGGSSWLTGTGTSLSLAPGSYAAGSILVRQSDNAGNTSANVQLGAITVDTSAAAPSLSLASDSGANNTDGITNIGTINLSGLETGGSWRYSVNGGTSWLTGTGTSFSLAPGSYAAGSILVRQSDIAGNTSANGQLGAITVDTTGPIGSLKPTAPGYAAPSTNPFGISDAGALANPSFADIDGDGDLDLFIGNNNGCTIFFRNTATAGATAPAYAAPSINPFGITDVGWSASPSLVDIDGDGDLDLFIGETYGNTLFYRNTATTGSTSPAYAAPNTNPFNITNVGYSAKPSFADIDKDGDLDLFIGNGEGNILFYRNTANPGATAPTYAAPSVNPFGITDVGDNASSSFADIDADGDLDLLIGNANGDIYAYRNNASATATNPAYGAPSKNPFGIAIASGYSSLRLADIDRDGDLDLFVGIDIGNTLFFRNIASKDPVAPLTSSTANGYYRSGATINITLQFSEAVYVTTTGGTPRLQLETGAIDRYALYSGGSGTNTLSFSYTVEAGDSSADLDQVSSSALELNGGSIRDLAGNNAILTLATPGAPGSLAANRALVVDAIMPIVTSVVATGADLSNGNGNLNAGKVVTITVYTSEPVTISGGTPSLSLNSGGSATYTSGGGTASLVFSYTVAAGHATNDLAITGLNANGAILSDLAGNSFVSFSNSPAGVLVIDTTAPTTTATITAIADDLGTIQGTVAPGGSTNDPTPTISGSISTALATGESLGVYSGATLLGNASVNNTAKTWTFTPTALASTAGTNYAITARVADAAGNLGTASVARSFWLDTTASTPGLALASDTGINNSDRITKVGTVNISSLESGATWQYSVNGGGSWLPGTGTSFSVAPGTYGTGSILVRQSDLVGNTSANGPLGATSIDTTAPAVSSVVATGSGISSGNGNLNAGKVVTLTVNTSEPVTISGGTPSLSLNSGGSATYTSGSGTASLVFSYIVAAGNSSSDLAITAFNTNGASLTDAAGNSFASFSNSPAGVLVIDTTAAPPSLALANDTGASNKDGITNIGAVNISGLETGASWQYSVNGGNNWLTGTGTSFSVAPGTYGAGSILARQSDLAGNTSANGQLGAITIDTTAAAPSLTLVSDAGISSSDRITNNAIVNISGLESGANWQYSVNSGSNWLTGTGTSFSVAPGTYNAGQIQARQIDLAGNTSANGQLAAFTVDTSAPTVSSVLTTTYPFYSSSGNLNAGKVVTLTVYTSEPVTISGGTPSLSLNSGGSATYISGSGSSSLVFSYTVAAGDNSSDLAITALNANGASLTDAAGNSFASFANNPAGILVIDTAAPAAPSLALASDFGISDTDNITNFSRINVNGLEAGASWEYSVNGGSSWFTGTGTFFYLLVSGSFGAGQFLVRQIDRAGNISANGQLGAITIDIIPPAVNSVVATGSGISSGNGYLNAGKVVTLTVNTTEPVTIRGGTPTLSLNSGGSATYISGSGTNSLVFSYTVATGHSSSDLAITALNTSSTWIAGTNGSYLTDVAGNWLASFSNSPAGVLVIDTAAAAPSLALASDTGGSNTDGITNIGTVNISGLETGASWQYSLNGGSNWLAGSGTSFSVAPGTYAAGSILARQSDLAGNTSANGQLGAITIDTTAAAAPGLALASDTGISNSDLITNSGKLNINGLETSASWQYSINGGSNWLTGTGASFTLAPGTYGAGRVLVRQRDLAGNTSANGQLGAIRVDSTAPAVSSVVATGTGISSGNGNLNADKVVTLTVNTSEPVTISGGTPSLSLNSGGSAIYASGSGTSSLVFSYTVVASHSSSDLAITALNVNGASLTDAAGNSFASFSRNPAGVLVIDTTAPAAPSLTLANDSGDSNKDGITNIGTVNVSGLEAGASWQYSIDGGSNWLTGTGAFFSVAPGTYGTGSILARQSDLAGNTSANGQLGAITIDTTAPTTSAAIIAIDDNFGVITALLAEDALTDDSTPTLSGSISAALATGENLRIFNGVTPLGNATVNNTDFTWSFTPTTALANGFYTITARVADAAGNLAAASPAQRFSIDATANQLIGDANANTLTATTAKDVLTGLGGVDTFKFTALTSSTLASFDRITDFSIGTDLLDGPTAVAAANINKLGAVSALSATSISTVLTAATFLANRAATFSYADPSGTSRSFIALNNATAGYQSSTDAIIEITGYIGSLDSLQVI